MNENFDTFNGRMEGGGGWFSSNEPRLDKETSTGALKLISEMSREAGTVSLETGK